MGDDRNRILDLLAAGTITAEEAARLLDALEGGGAQAAGGTGAGTGSSGTAATGTGGTGEGGGRSGFHRFFNGVGAKTTERPNPAGSAGTPKHLFVKVLSTKGDNVNVKIPLALLRAGLKLTALIPPQAADQINKTMAEKGMSFDLSNFKPQDLEELVDALRDMEIDIDAANGDKVTVHAG